MTEGGRVTDPSRTPCAIASRFWHAAATSDQDAEPSAEDARAHSVVSAMPAVRSVDAFTLPDEIVDVRRLSMLQASSTDDASARRVSTSVSTVRH